MGWIKCSERLPKEGQRVWICCAETEDHDSFVECGRYVMNNWYLHYKEDFIHPSDVTHWMPRITPNPPEDEG